MLEKRYIGELLEINKRTKEYGLVLTAEDAKGLIEVRNAALRNFGRVELGIDVTKRLIETFSTSSFINEENYVSTLNELQEIFYYLKNETEDRIADDKLIAIIKDHLENNCKGSVELLKSALEAYARDFRRNLQADDLMQGGGK